MCCNYACYLLLDKQYFGLYTVGYYESITCTTHSASRIEWVYNYTEVVTSASGDMAVLGFTVNDSIHNGVYTCRGYSDETYTDLDVTIIAQGKYIVGVLNVVSLHDLLHCIQFPLQLYLCQLVRLAVWLQERNTVWCVLYQRLLVD